MNTRERLQRYRELVEKKDDEAAQQFRQEQEPQDPLFAQLMKLKDEVVPAICAQKDFILASIDGAMQDPDPAIRKALLESAIQETVARTEDHLDQQRENLDQQREN